MSIADGFNLWIGKQLAEIVIPVAIIALLATAYGVLWIAARVEAALRRLRWRQRR